MSIKIETLRCFSHVARSGNLAEAAARLGRTQSAVSMTLKQLEDDLGQKLFQGERKNRLTPLGEQVFALAQQQVQNFDTTVREIRTSASSPRGLLRIASIPSVVGQLVPRAVGELITKHDGLKVDVRDTDTAMVIDALLRGQADVGIVSGAPSLNGVRRKLLFQDRFGLTCAATHPFAHQELPMELDDVLQEGFISNNLCQQITHPAVQQALANTRIHAHNTLSLIGLIQSGKWFTILPRSVVQDLPGDLVFRQIAAFEANRLVSTLISERSSQIGVSEDFVDILERMGATN